MRKNITASRIKKQRESVIKANERWLNSHEAKPNGANHPWKTGEIKSCNPKNENIQTFLM
jgi:hypothetical protein